MDSLVRYRAWVIMAVACLVTVLAVTLGGGTKHGGGHSGGGVPSVSYGAQVAILGPARGRTYNNGWVVRSGRQAIAVYAGTEPSDPHNGLFVIVRRTGAHQRVVLLVARGSGSVTLLRPAAPPSEQAAFSATLHFITANGGSGTLSLAANSLSVSR
jgi:hypothetical protein